MSTLKNHRKQWLILRQEMPRLIERYPHFRVRKISSSLYLYYDSDLNIRTIDWADGTSSLVLGKILGRAKNPLELHYQTGRFVAITDSVLSLDATGYLGVYFTTKRNALVCCSSQVLASEILNEPIAPGRDLKTSRMNWDPVPLARLKGLKRLFTDQILHLAEGTTGSRQRLVTTGQNSRQASENLARILRIE